MPGRDKLCPDAIRVVKQLAKLDPVVALHARIRRPPGRVLTYEIVDDLDELGLQIQRIKGNAQLIRHPPGVLSIRCRAATLFVMQQLGAFVSPLKAPRSLLAAGDRRLLTMAHKDTDHVVPLLHQQMGRDARIHSTTHRQHNSRHIASLGLGHTSGKYDLVAVRLGTYNLPSRPFSASAQSSGVISAWKKNSSIARRPFARASSSCETLFDWETKKNRVAEIDAQMAEANFWNNQEKAQATVEERKSLNSILLPLDNILKSSDDLSAMIEMAEE